VNDDWQLSRRKKKGNPKIVVNVMSDPVGLSEHCTKALNLMTVQPKADQPSVETGADLKSDTG
jgi:hypothetical protein